MSSLLNAEDVAAMLGVSRDWIYGEVRAGRLPHVRLGRTVRFRAETIDRWLGDLEAATMRDEAQSAPARLTSPGAWPKETDSNEQ